jgi:hypothetical protein
VKYRVYTLNDMLAQVQQIVNPMPSFDAAQAEETAAA